MRPLTGSRDRVSAVLLHVANEVVTARSVSLRNQRTGHGAEEERRSHLQGDLQRRANSTHEWVLDEETIDPPDLVNLTGANHIAIRFGEIFSGCSLLHEGIPRRGGRTAKLPLPVQSVPL
jgi:hypothetical protein